MRRFGAARSNLHLDVVFHRKVARTVENLSIENIQGKVIQKMHDVDSDIDRSLDHAYGVQDRLRPAILNRARCPRERPRTHAYPA
jgi:hypothetical protein